MIRIILLICLMLTACNDSTSNRYDTVNKDTWTKTTIKVIWVNKSEIDKVCSDLGTKDGGGAQYGGCARSSPLEVNVCEVYAPQPENFNDDTALVNLGHEVWHCFGAKHK